jgi:HlyD family secretion protein
MAAIETIGSGCRAENQGVMKMILRRKIIIPLLVILIATALIYGFSPKPIAVETVAVSRGLLQVVIEEEGKTRLKDRFEISAPVAGNLCRLDWKVGDPVKAGQQLCEITPLKSVLLDSRSKAKAEDRVAAAKASLRSTKAKVMADVASTEFAQSEYHRIKQIYDKKLISRSALERAESEQRRADATLESSRFAAETARYSLAEARNALSQFDTQGKEMSGDRVVIHSPVDGQILAIYKESEGTVSAGQVLMEIGDAGTLEVMAEVLSADAVRIQVGMDVEFERWGGEQPLTGQVRVIEPTGFTKVSALGVEEQRVRVIVDITSPIEQWTRLGDGYHVDTKFILWQKDDVLQIPENALFRYEDGWAVFVAGEDKRAELRIVKPGKRSGLYAQILSGLNAGENVITHPDELIEDGRQIGLDKK